MFNGSVTDGIHNLLETTERLSHLTTRQQSEDAIHKQLAAFERLLQHSITRFSRENAYHLLRHITRWAETDDRSKQKRSTKISFKLRSIKQLQQIVEKRKTKTKTTAENETIFKQYELFLNDLMYLKDLKKYFDDEIYSVLVRYHYASDDTPRYEVVTGSDARMKHVGTIKIEDEDSGHGSQIETDESRVFLKVDGYKKNKSHKEEKAKAGETVKFKETVNSLRTILHKWDGLLSDDALDLNDFDPDSYHDLVQFSNYSQFETLLRLVPDIFAKCYKCIDLAKTWLQLSNIVLKDEPLPVHLTPVLDKTDQEEKAIPLPESIDSPEAAKEIFQQIKELKQQVETIDKSISEDQKLLQKYNEEMETLVGRDGRFSSVSSHVDKIESLLTIAAGEYQKSKTEQYALASKMKTCKKGTPTYAELKSHLKRLDTEVAQNHWTIKRLEFERTLVQEDLLVEAEIRPSFIRFLGDTKGKVDDLERFLEIKREEKLKLEKQLALTKTNTERMRQIMRSYISSASTTTEKVSRESSLMSDDLPEFQLVDGNEADDDSSSTHDIDKHGEHKRRGSAVHQKPILVVKGLRPSSEKLTESNLKKQSTIGRVAKVGPKAALKSTPKRVWENV